MKAKFVLVCLVTVLSSFIATAGEDVAFQASLTPDIAIYEKTQLVKGLTLSIWGENPQSSAAFGFVNGCTGDSLGASFGLVNYADAYKGAQFSFFNNNDSLHGVQFGFLNYTAETKTGIQFGLINIIDTNKIWFKDFPRSLAPVMIFVNWRFED
ncbi:MAG: hypothetical protein L3J71_18055 [Victivallaceae bacterium]|nr:hypothetical protein [Victivallaceae bacterium]